MSEILLKSPSDCIKIDKYNFKSMLEGYEKNGKIIRTSIYCQTIRFPDNFLITPSKGNDDSKRPPSQLGLNLFDGKSGSQIGDIQYPLELKYIAKIDTIYELKDNSFVFWKEICTNDLWDIWKPEAPYTTLEKSSRNDKKIFLYLLRLLFVNRTFIFKEDWDKISDYTNILLKDIKVNIIKPVLPNTEFSNIKTKLEDTLSKFDILKNKTQISDTLNIFNNTQKNNVGEKNMATYTLNSNLIKKQKEIDIEFDKLKKEGKVDFITFHPSYSYEEFIEGITIKDDKELEEVSKSPYVKKDGLFKKICTKALYTSIHSEEIDFSDFEDKWIKIYKEYLDSIEDKSKEEIREWWKDNPKFLLIIDEINRGDISKIFGELITLLESDKRLGQQNELIVKLPYTGDEFGVPPNVYIIGTMNTADRSIALIDVALRRRFGFCEMPPEFDQLRGDFDNFDDNSLLGKSIKKLEIINQKIRNDDNLGKEKEIGHSFFYAINGKNDEAVVSVWLNEIFPLLEEYYYGESDALASLINNNIYQEKRFTKDPEEVKGWIRGD